MPDQTSNHHYLRNITPNMYCITTTSRARTAKKSDENIGDHLWRVHDKLYNLDSFISTHPGGSEWISMTTGTDITEAFETSHVLRKSTVERVLEKYYVADTPIPRNSPYTFKNGGFLKTLQERAEPVLKRVGTGPTKSLKLWQDFLVFLYLAMLYACATHWPTSLLAQLATGIVLGACTVCSHNFCHVKDNWRKYYMDLSLLSSYEWRLGHNLSHHLFPNTILDYEVYLFEPVLQLSTNKKRTWAQKYLAHFYLYGAYSQYFGLEVLKRIILVFFKRSQTIRPENFIALLEFFACAYLTGSIIVTPLLMTFIIQSTASFYFTFVGEAMAAHHHPDSFHEGDPVRSDPDFGLCQLDVTQASVEQVTKNIFIAASTFSEHPLHHLFPTVCHSKLHHLQPVVQEMLEEYSEKIRELNTVEKVVGIHYTLPGKN